MVAAILLVLLIAAFVIYEKQPGTPGFTGEKSIAVLPFENADSSKSAEYDGITQDIIDKLSKVSSLQKVIGWFSVRGFRNTTKTLRQIADQLGVAAILTGSIQKKNDKTSIVAELIEVSTNKRLWGDNFEFGANDVLTIQSKVSTEIVTALNANISAEDKKKLTKNYTENIEAYKLYRRGRWFWDRRSKENYDSAEANYNRAIQLDPDYALAYAGLADCYTYNQKGGRLSQLEAVPIAKDYANKALQLDSALVEAQTTLAFIQSHFDYDWEGAKIKFEKIIRDNPNYAVAHRYYGNVLISTGNSQAAIDEEKKALALDPLSLADNMVLGRHYYFARDYDRAITQLQKTVTINPKFYSGYWHLGNAFIQKKLYTRAIEAYSKMPANGFDQSLNGTMSLSIAYAASGDKIRAEASLAKIPKEDYLRIDPVVIAQFYTSMGNFDEALTQLERGFDVHSINMIALRIDPFLDPLRNTTRFKVLMKKMNFE